MRDNRFECGCERGRRCDTTSYCQVQDMADEYEDRIAELEQTVKDALAVYTLPHGLGDAGRLSAIVSILREQNDE